MSVQFGNVLIFKKDVCNDDQFHTSKEVHKESTNIEDDGEKEEDDIENDDDDGTIHTKNEQQCVS